MNALGIVSLPLAARRPTANDAIVINGEDPKPLAHRHRAMGTEYLMITVSAQTLIANREDARRARRILYRGLIKEVAHRRFRTEAETSERSSSAIHCLKATWSSAEFFVKSKERWGGLS